MVSQKTMAWSAAGFALYFGVFGIQNGFLIIFSVSSFLIGSLAVCLYYGKLHSDATYGQAKVPLAPSSVGIPKLVAMMEEMGSNSKKENLDRRLTGASSIDEQLQDVLDYVFKYYIEIWYKEISDDSSFLLELRKMFNIAISNFASRAKEVDWTPFFTEKLVDELASHVKLYRRADQKHRQEVSGSADAADSDEIQDAVGQYFFEMETEMEGNICREAVSTFEENEKRYLQDVVEAVLFFLLPDEVFDQRMFRFLVREVFVHGIILPSVDRVSEPDYVSQLIIPMCDDSTLTSENFLTALKMSQSIPEVQSVSAKVKDEMLRVRAKDTGGIDDSSIKQTLSSLSYLQKICGNQIKRIASKLTPNLDFVDGVDVPNDLLLKSTPIKELPFVFVLANDLGIQYFNDYLISNEKEVYLNILLDIECFHKMVIPRLQGQGDKMEAVDLSQGGKMEAVDLSLNMINEIYDKYFVEAIPNLQIESSVLEPVLKVLKSKTANSSVFDILHDVVMEHLERFYEDFKKHELYLKMLRDLDMDIDSVLSEESYDVTSLSSGFGGSDVEKVKDTQVTATIIKTGIVKDKSAGGKSYAVYSIQVTELTLSTGATKKWQTTRRYSDFYHLYVTICDKYPALTDLPFPNKKTFNNMNKEFLEKRTNALIQYMQMVLDSEVYSQHSSLRKVMSAFLHSDAWDRPKHGGHKKVGSLVNPLKLSVKQMGSKVRAVPDALFGDVIDGFGKMFTKLGAAPNLPKGQLDSHKVGATLDSEDDDNIPMRIMLLLLDEVFDLRKKNQWLRRRIVAILRQIVKATYGDRINRRIVDHVEMLTSADHVAEYVKQMKERFWPSGLPAEPNQSRDEDTQLRTAMVCKAKMIGSVPDELRHLIGTETTRAGVLRVFTMSQHKRLNKRLIFVIMEAFLQTLFPQSQFGKEFRQIHGKLQRGRADSTISQGSTL